MLEDAEDAAEVAVPSVEELALSECNASRIAAGANELPRIKLLLSSRPTPSTPTPARGVHAASARMSVTLRKGTGASSGSRKPASSRASVVV